MENLVKNGGQALLGVASFSHVQPCCADSTIIEAVIRVADGIHQHLIVSCI
jgi:hypothetical protein